MSPPTRTDVAGEPAAAAQRALTENPRLWYHTIELAPGVVTPGFIDLRKTAERVLPDDMTGVRALDVGTFDGFWAFEMERRGAEVVAIDLERIELAEFPPLRRIKLEERREEEGFELGVGFRLASEAIESRVSRVVCNVYDLTPEVIGGPVDLALNGATLTHLRDPVRALERIHDALVPGGELLSVEPVLGAAQPAGPAPPERRVSRREHRLHVVAAQPRGDRCMAERRGLHRHPSPGDHEAAVDGAGALRRLQLPPPEVRVPHAGGVAATGPPAWSAFTWSEKAIADGYGCPVRGSAMPYQSSE